jgi:uncharacterized protein
MIFTVSVEGEHEGRNLMPNKHGDFIWYELMTSDLEGSSAFYGPLLGWHFADSGQEGMDYRIFSTAESAIGGVMPLPSGAPMPPCWLGYIGVDDVDRSAANIMAVGGALHMEPQDIPGVGRFAFVADPQGAMFYIMKGAVEGGESLSFSSDKPRPGHCAWNELATSDQAGALAFYSSQFGWVKDGDMDMGPMGKYEFLRHDFVLGAMMTKLPQQPIPAWSYYFRVADIDAAQAQINAGGGQIIRGPQEVPGGDWTINGIDPQGAHFAVVGQKG